MDALFGIAFAGSVIAVGCGLFHLHVCWNRLHRLLQALAALPLAAALDQLPDRISALFGRYLNPQRPRRAHQVISLHQWNGIVRALSASPDVQQWLSTVDLPLPPALMTLPTLSPTDEEDGPSSDEVHEFLHRACVAALAVVQRAWDYRPTEEAFASQPTAAGDPHPPRPYSLPGLTDSEAVRTWVRMLEDFVAMHTVTYLSQFFAPLRNLINFVILTLLLLVLAVASYPFQPQHLLLVSLLCLLTLAVIQVIVIFVQMDRDEVLSRISKTTPYKITFDPTFFSTVLTYVTPLIAVALALFGDLGALIASLFDPVVRAVK